MDNLWNSGAQVLVMMWMAPAEQRYMPHAEDGFPLPEMQWVKANPAIFTRTMIAFPHGMVYLIRTP